MSSDEGYCPCQFCTSLAEGSACYCGTLQELLESTSITLPARILEPNTHTYGYLQSVDPLLITWKFQDKRVAPANDGEREHTQFQGPEAFEKLSQQFRLGSRKRTTVRLGVKVQLDADTCTLYDVQKLVTERPSVFSFRDPDDRVTPTPQVYNMFPKFSEIKMLTDRECQQVAKRQRVDGNHIIQIARYENDGPTSDSTHCTWKWTDGPETWTAAAVGRAILEAAPGDTLPPLQILASENDGGFWVEMQHPDTSAQVKLLLSVVVLAWWEPYARLVEKHILKNSVRDPIRSIMNGERFVRSNMPAEVGEEAAEDMDVDASRA